MCVCVCTLLFYDSGSNAHTPQYVTRGILTAVYEVENFFYLKRRRRCRRHCVCDLRPRRCFMFYSFRSVFIVSIPYCFYLIPKANWFLLICFFAIDCSGIQKHESGKLYQQNTTRVIIVLPFERKKHLDTFQPLF